MKSPISQLSSLRFLCFQCSRDVLLKLPRRNFITTKPHNLSEKDSIETLSNLESIKSPSSPNPSSKASSLSSLASNLVSPAKAQNSGASPLVAWDFLYTTKRIRLPPHHLHIYATRHNCHITLSTGDRQPLISVSSGNIGFRKAARGSYDAGFQLGSYVMGRIRQQELANNIQHIEVILRDFGPGREAMIKILLGTEGMVIRDKIIRVMDATRLKHGGTRSKKPRRLG